MAIAQGGKCGCGCGAKLDVYAIGEHFIPVAMGNEEKPDGLWNRKCADEKTNGFLGDKHKIAKVKRISEGRTQYDKRKANGSKLKGRGFQGWRTFDGSIVRKDD